MTANDPVSAPLNAPRSAGPLIFLIVFLDLLGVGLIVPLGPYIVEKFSTTATALAVLTLSYSAAQFLSTPCLGAISDRIGRRPVLLVSLLGSTAGYVVFALAGSLPVLYLSRIVAGATGGNISTAQAYLADITPPKDRAKAYGLIGAAFGLGFTLGPAMSSMLVGYGLMTPVWAAAGLSLVTAGLVAWLLPETLPREARTAGRLRARQFNPFAVLLDTLKMPLVPVLLVAIFALAFAHAELRVGLGMLMRDKFEYTAMENARIFAYIGLVAVLVQGGLVRKLSPMLGDRRVVLIGLPTAAVGYALLPVVPAPHWGGLLIALGLLGLGGGIAGPSLTSLISRVAPRSEEGKVMGASQSVSALALVFGPLAAGPLYDGMGWGWPFWTAAGFVVFALVVVAVRGVGRGIGRGE
ncbi:MAG: MFS transporter [Planctomycetota bacterium]|nr:MFS transporter [Planctomycetota bacterium]